MRVSHLRSQDAKAARYRLVYFLFLSMSLLKKKKSFMIVSNPFFAVGILHQGSYLIQISKLAFILLSTLRQNFKEKRTFQSANMMFGCEEQVQSSLCIPFSMFVFPHCVTLILACFHVLRRSFHVCGNPLGHMVCIVHSNSSTSRMKMGNIGASSTSISPWLCYF